MTSQRVLYTLVTFLIVFALYALMVKGWRGRQRRQGDLPPPPTPPEARGDVLVGAVPGLFVGTTFAGEWLERVAVHDLAHRAAGWLLVTTDGVHIEREGAGDLYLPFAAVQAVARGDALAGKVVGKDGLLLLDWQLGNRLLRSGFRADDHTVHARLEDVIGQQLGTQEVHP